MMIVIGLGIVLTGLVVYSLCKVASESDRDMEEMYYNKEE